MKILSISGGGFQALYNVILLEELEKLAGPVKNSFDLFCGTSAGAIVAAAGARGMPMADLRAGMGGRLGASGGGPAPFRKEDRSRFLQALDRELVRLGR